MVLCVTRFFHSRFFLLRKFNFNVNFVTLPSSHLEKILKTFYFPLWRSLGFFSLSKLRFTANCVFFSLRFFPVTFHFDSYGRSSPDSDDTESVTSTTSEHEKCTWKL
ncbi:unnamed protein product [Rhizophagus irregularis]|nr:unnamed protein product [Rhizophagus irregularis]